MKMQELLVNGSHVDYSGLPEHMREGMRLYIEHGIEGGSFMMAVLENDLMMAVARADHINQERILIGVNGSTTMPHQDHLGVQKRLKRGSNNGMKSIRARRMTMELKITRIYEDTFPDSLTINARGQVGTVKVLLEIGVAKTEGLACKARLGDTIEVDVDAMLDKHYVMPLLEHKE